MDLRRPKPSSNSVLDAGGRTSSAPTRPRVHTSEKSSDGTRPKRTYRGRSRADQAVPDALGVRGGGKEEAERPRQKKSRRRGGLSTSVQVLVAVAILTVLALNLVPIGLQWLQQEQEYQTVSAEAEAVRAHNAELQATLEKWDDPDYVAMQARGRLGFVRPGEVQYTVADLPEEAEEGDPSLAESGVQRPWMSLILESMQDADQPPASNGLSQFEPTEDPETMKDQDQ